MRIPCKSARKWVCNRLQNRYAFAPFTGQDARAFDAFAHLLELYLGSDMDGRDAAVAAMGAVLLAMQPKCRPLAKAAIPWMLDWSDEETLWEEIGGAS